MLSQDVSKVNHMHSLALGLGRKTKQCAREDILVQICEGVTVV